MAVAAHNIDDRLSVAGERRSQEATARRERTRAKLLDAAFRLIGHERGLSVRIEEVCVAAQVSRGTFYNYFSSMDELFAALSFELLHEFNRSVFATMNRMQDSAERTNAAMRYYLERARRDPQWGWAMIHISANGPLFGAETFAHALKTVKEGINRGEFDLKDPEFGRDMILGTVFSSMRRLLRDGGPASVPETVARHILRSLGVAEARVEEIVTRPLPPPTLD
jgi:AcrR family transcriptional regulator